MASIALRVEEAFAATINGLDMPERLKRALAYGTLGGGKRVRPFLVFETARLFGASEKATSSALALEAIHCYSLIHDDLPAMDNDDLRRGQPSLHKAFDEATAILAGDSLQSLAFELIAADEALSDKEKVELTLELARASGGLGMAGGQMLDLEAEGRFENGAVKPLDAAEILHLQSMKTGALFRFATLSGVLLGHADEKARHALVRYADAFGKAFQISDDLLDVTGNAETLGKTPGKDISQGKATLISLWGIDRARQELSSAIEEGEAALNEIEGDTGLLSDLLYFLGKRES